MKKQVVIAMSGGVDSSVSAFILAKQGYEVIGVNMRLSNLGSPCCGGEGMNDAKDIACKLGIPFYVFNFEREFENEVINYFCHEYINGRTPNPCIICNEKIKFGLLLNKAKELAVPYIATGHYARVFYDKSNKRFLLKKGMDKGRDQSYFLFSLSQSQLSNILFPLGNYTKNEVRALAKGFDLKVHNKPASQEICFITNNDYRKFLEKRTSIEQTKPGPIITESGSIVGKHKGIAFYTIGQRKGIGAYKKPFYVIAIDKDKDTITIGEEERLYSDVVCAENVNWIARKKSTQPIKAKAKIRYKHQESDCLISMLDSVKAKIKFEKPQRAITKGQAVVFYESEIVIGGGWIC